MRFPEVKPGEIPATLLAGAVRGYQLTLRGVIGANCRFEPSCSHYALEALGRHGAARGSRLTVWRVLRCNPWCAGGHDPVPPCDCPSKGLTAR